MTTDPTPSPADAAALAFNAVTRTAAEQRRFLSLIDRQRIADAVLAAVSPVIRRQVAEEIAEEISDNVRNEDWSKQDRGGFYGVAPKMAYVAGHDRAAAIARTHAHPEEGK